MRKCGYGATGLQDILNEAKVPKGSFYHHFGSKEAFTAVVLERYVALEYEHCRVTLGNMRQAPLRRLRRYFEELVVSAGAAAPIHGCLVGRLTLEIAGSSEMLQKALSENFAMWQGVIANVLREAVEQGALPKGTKPDMLAGFVLNSWEGAMLRSQADRSDAPLKEFLRFVFEGLLAEHGV